MSITIYKTKTCAVCVQVKKTLEHWKKDFKEVYIDDDPKLQQYVFEKSGGFLQVPLTVIIKDGQEHYVSGGNIARIASHVM